MFKIDWDKPVVTVNSKFPVTVIKATPNDPPNRLISWNCGDKIWSTVYALISDDGCTLISLAHMDKNTYPTPFVENLETPKYMVVRNPHLMTKTEALEVVLSFGDYSMLKVVEDE